MSDLSEMLQAQLRLQIDSFGKDPTRLNPDDRAEFIRWNTLALEDELHEALNEVGWKPWATNRGIDHPMFVKELTDAWHFFMNLLLAGSGVEHGDGDDEIKIAMDLLAEHFIAEYHHKRLINAGRQTAGYTGTDKCPTCKRDRATTQITETDSDGADGFTHCPCGHVYEVRCG